MLVGRSAVLISSSRLVVLRLQFLVIGFLLIYFILGRLVIVLFCVSIVPLLFAVVLLSIVFCTSITFFSRPCFVFESRVCRKQFLHLTFEVVVWIAYTLPSTVPTLWENTLGMLLIPADEYLHYFSRKKKKGETEEFITTEGKKY